MRYAHIEYTGRAGHPTSVCADAVCIRVGYTAATVRLVCRITCKLTCKIDLYTVHHRNSIFADPSLRYTNTVHATDYILSPVESVSQSRRYPVFGEQKKLKQN